MLSFRYFSAPSRPCVSAFLLLAACAQPPTKELAIAAARVEAAREQDAALFAPELLAEAESSLAEARRLAREGREFLPSIQAAAHATLRANEAFSRASADRIVAVRRLDRLLHELESLLEMAAHRGGESEDLSALRARYDAIRMLVEKRALHDALAAGMALKPELLAYEARLRE
jgi:hypothetical protein